MFLSNSKNHGIVVFPIRLLRRMKTKGNLPIAASSHKNYSTQLLLQSSHNLKVQLRFRVLRHFPRFSHCRESRLLHISFNFSSNPVNLLVFESSRF